MMIISPAKLHRETIPSSRVTLPEELITEVLSSLKVKSLLRFKCVNKPWNSLISDPLFVKMHLIKSSRNPHILLSTKYILSTSYIGLHNPFIILRNLLENPSISLFPGDSKYKLMEWFCHIIGSANGFTCLVTYSESQPEIEFYLWNPATRWLSQKLVSLYQDPDFKFSFGYDNLTHKYKVVAFRPIDVRVFTIGDNVWRNVQCFPTYPYRCPHTYNQLDGGVYFNNSLNWFSLLGLHPNYYRYRSSSLSVQQFVIISLDLGIETYTQILFPHDFDQVPFVPPIVCVLMECLCFSHNSNWNNFVIWQMKEFGVQESWTKLLKFDYHNQCGLPEVLDMLPLHVFDNGDTLIFASKPRQLILYNNRDNRVVRQSTITDSIHISWFNVNHYVESLLSTY